jgi:hypothetical protein
LISKGLFSLKELGQKLPTNFVTFWKNDSESLCSFVTAIKII